MAKTIIQVRAKLTSSLRASGANNFYDQIAWFSEPDGITLLDGIACNRRAGSFDFSSRTC